VLSHRRSSYRPSSPGSTLHLTYKFAIQVEGGGVQIVSETTRMHALETFFSFLSLQFQIVSNTFRTHALKTLFANYSLQFQIVLNAVRMHALETLFSFVSLQFQIVSNTIRIHALETLFSIFLCSSKSFQIPPDCML